MQIAIQRENGSRAEAVLLAASRSRMRVVVVGDSDTEEWAMLDETWRDEYGQRIEIDALLADEIDSPSVCAELGSRTASAGGSFA